MSATKAAWATVVWAVLAGVACDSSVTVDPSGGSAGSDAGSSPGGPAGAGATTGQGGADATGAGGAGATGGQGGGATGGQGGAGGAQEVCPGAGDACTGCLSEQCADVYCGCYNEIHCGGYLQCLGTCMQGDTACYQNCATVHEPGLSAAILTADCAATTCDASCSFGQPLSGCQKCLYTACAPQMNACIADPECTALIQCLQTCTPGDMPCIQACIAQHPDGLPEAQDVRDCRIDNCDGACD
jgi:hypothetical protein